jgi:hypothetical protein
MLCRANAVEGRLDHQFPFGRESVIGVREIIQSLDETTNLRGSKEARAFVNKSLDDAPRKYTHSELLPESGESAVITSRAPQQIGNVGLQAKR